MDVDIAQKKLDNRQNSVLLVSEMVLEELKSEVERLSPEERHELAAFLNKLRLENDEEFWKRVRRRMDDKDPAHWVNIDDIK